MGQKTPAPIERNQLESPAHTAIPDLLRKEALGRNVRQEIDHPADAGGLSHARHSGYKDVMRLFFQPISVSF